MGTCTKNCTFVQFFVQVGGAWGWQAVTLGLRLSVIDFMANQNAGFQSTRYFVLPAVRKVALSPTKGASNTSLLHCDVTKNIIAGSVYGGTLQYGPVLRL